MSGIHRGVKALQRALVTDPHKRAWRYIDATDQVVGRLASCIVPLLTGKYRPDYLPHDDKGDYVVVR
jgi:ribosomal protein L13